MNEGLEALEMMNMTVDVMCSTEYNEAKKIVEKELKELDKIKARLVVVNMKLASKREECVENMNYTDEDDFVHEVSETEIRCIDWFQEMLKEVLL